MGFYQLIPAKNPATAYEPQTRTLYLFAEGDARKYTSGTKVVITVSGGIATFVMQHVIDVEIVVLSASTSVAPSTHANGKVASALA